MTEQPSIFLPAFGKVVELLRLDDFVWATLRGWGALPASIRHRTAVVTPLNPELDASTQAATLTEWLKREEEDLRLVAFAEDEAGKDYRYLFSLVTVRLWAMVESAAREVLVEAAKTPSKLPNPSALVKLKGAIAPFVGAEPDTQAELIADLLWRAPEGQLRGIDRFDAALARIGLPGSPPTAIDEILRELSEVRHCVVHRGGMADRRFMSACPWIVIKPGDPLPATLKRFWFYRNAAYWYVMDLARRWARWRNLPAVIAVADQMEAVVFQELVPAWKQDKRIGGTVQ